MTTGRLFLGVLTLAVACGGHVAGGVARTQPQLSPSTVPKGPASALPGRDSDGTHQESFSWSEWKAVFGGRHSAHALPNREVAAFVVRTDDWETQQHYCSQSLVKDNAVVAEQLTLANGDEVWFAIARTSGGGWLYIVRGGDGETMPGSSLCADCHERGRELPFFGPPVGQSCR